MREFTRRSHASDRLRLAAVAALVVAFAGCSETHEADPGIPPQLWSISGTVSGAVSSGVTVRVVGLAWVTTTDAAGRYTLTGLVDGSYTLAASLDGFAFSPATRAVTVSGANVTGQDFAGRVSAAISGTVAGEAGEGVTVTLTGPAPATTTTTVTTDADGRYEFADVLDGVYRVTPSLAGGWEFAPANSLVTVSGASVSGPDFTSIAAPRAISGRIAGAVTAGVTVTLSGGADAVAVTDAAGSYSFTGLASGSYVVTPSRTGYAFKPAEIALTIERSDATGQDFIAATTHRIAGRISGDAVSAIPVALEGAVTAGATTDASGYFEFPGLVDGTYVVTPSLAGYTFGPATRAVALAGADVTSATFTATRLPTYSVTGVVSGSAQAGVTMTLVGGTTVVTTTDASGAFALTDVPPGDYLLIPSLEDHVFDPASRLLTVSGASVAGQTFIATLSPSARTISGTVSGDAVAGVTVALSGVAPVTATVTALTDAEGHFTFRDLDDGLYLVTPSLAGGYAFVPANSLVTVSGASVAGVDFVANAVPHAISGRVSGAVIENVTVTLAGAAGATTTTDASGDYQFTGLLNGDYTVTPSLAGYVFGPAAAAVTLAGADAPGVNFVAAATHRIAGTISGDVVSGVTVTLSGAATDEVTTDGTGRFEFTVLADGSYEVTAALEGYAFDPPSRPVVLAGADATGEDFTATLVPTYSVSGTVSGSVLAGVTVRLSGAAPATTTTDGAGAYSFTGLSNGSYMVIPSLDGHVFDPASRAFRVNGANVTGQDFTAP